MKRLNRLEIRLPIPISAHAASGPPQRKPITHSATIMSHQGKVLVGSRVRLSEPPHNGTG
jgi:hypothetical protein